MPLIDCTASRNTTSTGKPAWSTFMTDAGGIFAIIERAKRSPCNGVYVMVGLSLYVTPAAAPRYW